MTTQQVDVTTIEPISIKNIYVPTTGSSILLNQARNQRVLLNPAGSLLSLTITFPDAPVDGDIIVISSSQAITTLTINGNGKTVNSALASLSLGGFGRWCFDSSVNIWFRIG